MAEKHILFAHADTQAADELKAALGQPWVLVHAPDATAAVAAVESQRFDVFVADLNLFTRDAAEFASFIQKTDPRTIRLVLAAESDRSRVLKEVPGAHQFIARPCDVTGLHNIIERTCTIDIWSANEDIRKLISQVRTLPAMPSLYLEIQAALQSRRVTTEQVSSIIARDMAMTTKLLQLLNTAGFGMPRQITDLNEAVGILGFETVKSMVITIKLMSEFDRVKPVYFSVDRLWRRSTTIARLARQLILLHTEDQALGEKAFAAGLLHDIGKAMLAATFDEQYQAVQLVAREQQAPLWEVEKKNFGATHGEIGAYLLSLWGMPLDLLETAALHDHPSRSVNKTFSPLTAVHIAHVWESELNPESDGSLPPQIDGAYLLQLGLLNRLDGWRKAMSLPPSTRPVTAIAPKIIPPRAVITAKRKPATRQSVPVFQGNNGWFIAAGVGILLLLACFAFGPVERVAAKFANLSGADTATNYVHENVPAPAAQAGQLPPDSAMAATTAPVPVAETKPVKIIFPELKLQGVFYSSNSPSAIINGRLIHLNGEIDGAHLIEVGRSSVIVEFQNLRTNLSL